MALPVGVNTKLLTFGLYDAADGTLATSWSAIATISQPIRWAATGDVVLTITMQVVRSPDGRGSIRLPVTDQDGWIDKAGAPVKNWTYTITWSSDLPGQRPVTFLLPSSSPDPFDVDNVPVGSSVPSVAPGASAVTSITVAGVTYPGPAVTLPNSVAGVGASTVNGITDATDQGRRLLLAGDQNSALTILGIQGLAASIPTTASQVGAVATSAVGVAGGVATLDASGHQKYAEAVAGARFDIRCVGGVQPLRTTLTSRTDIFFDWLMLADPNTSTGYAIPGDGHRREAW